MPRKAILNITSRKKRNGMLTVTNTTGTGTSTGITVTSATVNGAVGGWFWWAATAQDLTDQNSTPGTIAEAATRTATNCYMRGLSEHVRIQTSSGIPWVWRRICFTAKSETLRRWSTADTAPAGLPGPYWDGSNGLQRLLFNSNVASVGNTINEQQRILFKGQSGVDWSDLTLAPVDTTRVTVKYDKTRIIRSGNASGTLTEKKLWHGMNKSLVYDDDESGSVEQTSVWSTAGKAGMGDYFIVDVIQPGTGGTTSDYLSMQCNSTLYWHER